MPALRRPQPDYADFVKCERPVLIVGTERSGSNLLRLVLNSHSRIAIPHPPHVMNLMHVLEEGAHKPTSPSAVRSAASSLARDVARLIRWHTNPWPFYVHPEPLLQRAEDTSLIAFYAASQEMYREFCDKPRWGCKSTFMIHHVEAFLRLYPQAQLLLLVRDPRDVAVSARKSVFNHFHPWYVAHLWAKEQRKGLEFLERLPSNQIHLVHYENLVGDPRREVQAICRFLGERFEESMLRFFETPEARISAALCADWKNTDAGFLAHNTHKYRKELTSCDIALVEAVAGDAMQPLGYALEAPLELVDRLRSPSLGRRVEYWCREHWEQVKVEYASFRRDRNYPLRVRKWLWVRYLRLRHRLHQLL